MIRSKFYKTYLLYAVLFLTILSASYFKYQEILYADLNIAVSAPLTTNDFANTDEGVHVENHNDTLAKVDIFEVYKTTLSEVEDYTEQKVVTMPVHIDTVALAPKPPEIPPIPFKYIGKILGDDEYQVFVSFNEKYLVLKEGDIVQQTYKIEKIAPPVMAMTYIPMNILQHMEIGDIK